MNYVQWRARFAQGLPVFSITDSPSAEVNNQPDMFNPSYRDTVLGATMQQEIKPAVFDGVTLQDMQDEAFASAHFAPNKLSKMVASIKYQRSAVKSYQEATKNLSKPLPRF